MRPGGRRPKNRAEGPSLRDPRGSGRGRSDALTGMFPRRPRRTDLRVMDPRTPLKPSSCEASGWTPEDFMRALHPPGSRGKVSLLAKTGNGVFARCFPAEEVHPVLPTWMETTAYFGVTRYAGPRGGARPVAELTCLYADLDTYRVPELAPLAREALAETVIRRIGALGLPEPSFLIDSGRGLYALWRIDPLSGQALPRWRAAQRCLVGLLAPLGADPACCDPARVLRIPGTLNGRCGRVVTVVRGDGRPHAFDDLADRIYQVAKRPTRGELAARRQRRAGDDAADVVRGLPPAARFAAVLRDLERFRLAWGGEIPEGFRNCWLHLVATALGFVATGGRGRGAGAAARDARERRIFRTPRSRRRSRPPSDGPRRPRAGSKGRRATPDCTIPARGWRRSSGSTGPCPRRWGSSRSSRRIFAATGGTRRGARDARPRAAGAATSFWKAGPSRRRNPGSRSASRDRRGTRAGCVKRRTRNRHRRKGLPRRTRVGQVRSRNRGPLGRPKAPSGARGTAKTKVLPKNRPAARHARKPADGPPPAPP